VERTRNILTPRQREIFELMTRDLPDKLIADAMGISIHTVKAQKNIAYKALNVHSGYGAMYKYLMT